MRDLASVEFDLLLARAAGLAQAATLPFKVGPAAHQPRRQVVELCELDLQLAFAALRTLRKDLEDQRRAIDHLDLERALEVALLRRAQRDVEHGEAGIGRLERSSEFLDLATTEEERRVRRLAARAQAPSDRQACGRRKLREFLEGIVGSSGARGAASADLHTDQERACRAFGSRRLDLKRSQAGASRLRLTGRAGTTVEIACL